jgi:hypothetical protein
MLGEKKTIQTTTFRPTLRGHLRAATGTVACAHCKKKQIIKKEAKLDF